MPAAGKLRFDEIGLWSELKIEIIKKYSVAYAKVLSRQKGLTSAYVDAFAGPGKHVRKGTHEIVEGSPTVALHVTPPFDEYYFIDIASDKIDYLKLEIGDRSNVKCFVGDANEILLNDVLPRIRYTDYKRGLCVLDPYGLHLDWNVIHASGQAQSIEIFLNFPVADMNRNVFWRNVEGVEERDIQRMTRYWGDESWRNVAYTTDTNLFGFPERTDNETIAAAFKDHLRKVAGFRFVPDPLPMKNQQGAVVYYLYFASQNRAGNKIATDIFKKYRT